MHILILYNRQPTKFITVLVGCKAEKIQYLNVVLKFFNNMLYIIEEKSCCSKFTMDHSSPYHKSIKKHSNNY